MKLRTTFLKPIPQKENYNLCGYMYGLKHISLQTFKVILISCLVESLPTPPGQVDNH